MAGAFKELDEPTQFLTGLFPSTEREKFEGEEVEIDSVRG